MQITKFTPMSNIYICAGTGLTSSYTDCYTFADENARLNWFAAKSRYTLNNAIPIRDNTIRVPYTPDELLGCDYVVFQNQNLNTRWIYCFITNISWVNIGASDITLKVDVITTWQFTAIFNNSFIKRSHVSDDVLGNYTQPEPMEVDNRLYLMKDKTGTPGGFDYVLYYIPEDASYDSQLGGIIRSACKHVNAPAVSTGFTSLMEKYILPLYDVGLQDNVLGIIVAPGWIEDAGGFNTADVSHQEYKGDLSLYKDLDGYTPVNQKLLTFPFNSLIVASANGLQNEYRIEEFENSSQFTFLMSSALSLDLVIYGTMVDYASQDTGYPAGMSMSDINTCSGFPQLLTAGIQSLAYMQNISSSSMGTMFSMLGAVGSAAMGNIAGTLGSVANTVNGLFSTTEAVTAPPIAKTGTISPSTASFSTWLGQFGFVQHCIDKRRAKVYDEYLTRWGYSINETKPLNFRKRKVFDYIETIDAQIRGNVPQEDLEEMRNAFDRGITFWHTENGYMIGDWTGAANGNPVA